MTQLVTRIPDGLVDAIDELVAGGVVASRSAAVRRGLEELVERERRARVDEQIVAAYQRTPQRDDESLWGDDDAVRMIAQEPW